MRRWGMSTKGIITPFPDELAPIDIENPDHREHLERCIVYYKTKLVVIDSLAGSSNIPENDKRIALPLYAMGAIAERTGAVILFNHHLNKPYDRGESSADLTIHNSRGSTAIMAVPRSVIALNKPDKDSEWIKVQVIKQNLAVKPPPVGMRITSTGLEFGEAPRAVGKESKTSKCEDWLRNRLPTKGWAKSTVIFAEGLEAGFSESTIHRARRNLDIQSRETRKDGKQSYSLWKLKSE
jgi:hypothetical protein